MTPPPIYIDIILICALIIQVTNEFKYMQIIPTSKLKLLLMKRLAVGLLDMVITNQVDFIDEFAFFHYII